MSIEYQLWFGAAAAVLAVVQYIPYVWDIAFDRTHPHAFSWFVWGLPTIIVFGAQLEDGGGIGAWATGITALVCTLIFVLSFWRGEREIDLLDWFCLGIALLGLVLWLLTTSPVWAVALGTAVDVVGFIPTIRKSLRKPSEETASTYVLGAFKWAFAVVALGAFSPVTLTYPLVMAICNGGFAGWLVWYRVRRFERAYSV